MSSKTALPKILEESAKEENHFPVLHDLPFISSPLISFWQKISLSDFELLNSLGNDKLSLGRKRDTNKLYTLKKIFLERSGTSKPSCPENVCMKIVNELKCAFLAAMHWSFEDQNCLYMVTVRIIPHGMNFGLPHVSGFLPWRPFLPAM